MERNYKVEVQEAVGACKSTIFKKLAEKGDITSEKVADNIGKIIHITGYALCHITTKEKEFDMNYFATEEGFLSTGSEIFTNSVTDYLDEISTFKIVEVKTRKGKTYKVTPILECSDNGEIL